MEITTCYASGQLLEEHERHQMIFRWLPSGGECPGGAEKGTLKIRYDELIGFSTRNRDGGMVNAGLVLARRNII